jgi:hypothetical protein
MRRTALWSKLALAVIVLSSFAVSQTSHKTRSLVINGHAGDAVIYQIDGKSFVDLEALIRIGNGSISFNGEQLVLSLPAGNVAAATTEAAHADSPGLSPDFMREAVQTLAVIKDWTDTLVYAAQNGVPGDGARLVVFHERSAGALRLAKVSATSESDQSALQLLTNHFNNVSAWSDKLVAERRSMDTGKYSMSQTALSGDEHFQKISKCNKFLGTMLPSGHYQDDYSCH